MNNFEEAARRVKVDKLLAHIDATLGTDPATAETAVLAWTAADWELAAAAANINPPSLATRTVVEFSLTCRTRLATTNIFKGLPQ